MELFSRDDLAGVFRKRSLRTTFFRTLWRGIDFDLSHRAVRDLNVDSELVKNTLGVDELLRRDPDGLILSGGPTMDRIGNCKLYVKEIDLPILGICLGHQLIAETFGGTVSKGASGGYAH